MKKFIITIDTEGDDQWSWRVGQAITTENILFMPRFQELSEKYGFKPVWLSNYEIVSDERFVKFISDVLGRGMGEVGMHLHAWNTPPHYDLPLEKTGAPYLIEYPLEVMEQKIATMTELIKDKIGVSPVSHRAGRWATDQRYFSLLEKYGYRVDCSVTPHVNWEKHEGQTACSAGSNYLNANEEPSVILQGASAQKPLIEVPVTVRPSHKVFVQNAKNPRSVLASVYRAFKTQMLWLRPNGKNLQQMKYLIDQVAASDSEYIMFMLHSSELMPGGSPRFKTEESIEHLYNDIESVFAHASQRFAGATLEEYYQELQLTTKN